MGANAAQTTRPFLVRRPAYLQHRAQVNPEDSAVPNRIHQEDEEGVETLDLLLIKEPRDEVGVAGIAASMDTGKKNAESNRKKKLKGTWLILIRVIKLHDKLHPFQIPIRTKIRMMLVLCRHLSRKPFHALTSTWIQGLRNI